VDDASLYKHIDSELPDPDRARQLVILCAARAPLPAREGKDPPSQPSEKGMKLLQEVKDDVLLLLAEQKLDMKVMTADQPGSVANGTVDVRANEQNINNRVRTARFKDEIRTYVLRMRIVQILRFADVHLSHDSAKAEDDAWAAVTHFYNTYQETVMRELEQWQKAKGKSHARPGEDLRISELPKQLQEASELALGVLSKDVTGEHNRYRWDELLYKV
jgi:kinetochore protein Mis13/DSN1